jgi:plastocyanin
VICRAGRAEHTVMQIRTLGRSLILPLLAAVVVGVVAFTLADHGTGASGSTASASTPVLAAKAVTVRIANFEFAPPDLTIRVGTRVTWTNLDGTAHTATADAGSFDTGALQQGQSMTIQFNTPGTFTYHCSFHAFMMATIKVVS